MPHEKVDEEEETTNKARGGTNMGRRGKRRKSPREEDRPQGKGEKRATNNKENEVQQQTFCIPVIILKGRNKQPDLFDT